MSVHMVVADDEAVAYMRNQSVSKFRWLLGFAGVARSLTNSFCLPIVLLAHVRYYKGVSHSKAYGLRKDMGVCAAGDTFVATRHSVKKGNQFGPS